MGLVSFFDVLRADLTLRVVLLDVSILFEDCCKAWKELRRGLSFSIWESHAMLWPAASYSVAATSSSIPPDSSSLTLSQS